MKNLILFGLLFCLFQLACTPSKDDGKKPDEYRFTEVELARGLDEPMEMTFLPGNKVLVVERKGGMKLIHEDRKEMVDAGWVEVNTMYTNKEGKSRAAEEGLMGVIADPNFADNHYIYMYYADPETPKHILARWEFVDDYLVDDSKKVLLEVSTQREECCHTGGGMTWDKAGNLYLTTGNNTVNPQSGASNLNELPGHENEDDQRTAGNSNDLRGKILRIHPEPDGTYSIPEGNLFPVGTEKTRPEIYTMGHRNPWRPTIDSKTGYLYWGEVGPDASKDSIWGPMGYDEFNQAKEPGNFGWPYFIGNNTPYNAYNSAEDTYGEAFDVNNVLNNSVNNTGIKELPRPVPAFIYYPYGPSPEFPLVGTSGRSATGGPVFRKADFKHAERPWPSYFEGKWLIVEFMRGWIMSVTMDEKGDYQSMERILPNKNFSGAIDMDFGPSGDLYVLEYGTAWFKQNSNSRLVKIEYNSGNLKPIVEAEANVYSGKLPLTVRFAGRGTPAVLLDKESKFEYNWVISKNGVKVDSVRGADATYTFEKAGDYEVNLIVTDEWGESNNKTILLTAGNVAPDVSIELDKENHSFYFGEKELKYSVSVKDDEDGTTPSQIKPEEVSVTFDYVPAGFDPIEMAANQSSEDQLASYSVGRNLIQNSDCISCHQFTEKSIGPSYQAVAERYANTAKNRELLVDKIINGGSGVWGDHGMSAHPDLDRSDAARMVDYVLSLSAKSPTGSGLGLKGAVSLNKPSFEDYGGSFVLRAAYKDKGSSGAKPLMTEKRIILKSPYLKPHDADFKKHTETLTAASNAFYVVGDKSAIGFENVDLTSVKSIDCYVQISGRSGAVGGAFELYLDDLSSPVVATSAFLTETPTGRLGPAPKGMSAADWRRKNTSKLSVSLPADIRGKHKVFMVFRNENAEANVFLMEIKEIGFSN